MNHFRYFHRSLVAVASIALASCASPDKPIAEQGPPTPAAAAEMAVMARHDSLMARMDELYRLKGLITKAKAPAAGPYIQGLMAADAAMMNWMHQYRAPDSTATPAIRLAYFQQQQQLLAAVSQQFRATIDSASLFVSRLPILPPPPSELSPPK